MKFYIDRKKRNLITESSSKDDTKMEYNAKSSIGRENVDISMTIKSKKEEKKSNKNDDGMSIDERIEKLELQISDLCSSKASSPNFSAYAVAILSDTAATLLSLVSLSASCFSLSGLGSSTSKSSPSP